MGYLRLVYTWEASCEFSADLLIIWLWRITVSLNDGFRESKERKCLYYIFSISKYNYMCNKEYFGV